jgi:antitoxin ParD1/3/4
MRFQTGRAVILSRDPRCVLYMKIITVNLPVSYLKAIDSLIGENGLYPSRSELIRVAVRDFLIKELEAAKSFTKYQTQMVVPNRPKELNNELFVQVPVEHDAIEGSVEYKTYRIVKK